MSDDNGGGAGIIVTGDGNGGGGGPEWLSGLSDDLKADATLSRYADIEALARGHLETKRLASSRIVLPGADADDAAWGSFYEQLGRPKDAADYQIDLPEGADAKIADQFRPIAHQLGLTPKQVAGLVGWNNELAKGLQGEHETAMQAKRAEGAAAIEALKSELGADYGAKERLAQDAAKRFGVEAETADKLVEVLGDRKAVELFMRIGEQMGEHRRVDGDHGNGGGFGDGGGDPDVTLSAKMADATWRAKASTKGSPEEAEYNRLVAAAARKEAVARERKAS